MSHRLGLGLCRCTLLAPLLFGGSCRSVTAAEEKSDAAVEEKSDAAVEVESDDMNTDKACEEGETRCTGDFVEVCRDGTWGVKDDCSIYGETCVMGLGEAHCWWTPDFDTGIDLDADADYDNTCECVSKLFHPSQGLDWLKDACITNISDECMQCMIIETERAECRALDRMDIMMALATCVASCRGGFLAPTDEAQCRDTVALFLLSAEGGLETEKDGYGDCLCVDCLEQYVECLTNTGCAAMWICSKSLGEGCIPNECLDSHCGPLIKMSMEDGYGPTLAANLEHCVSGDGGCFAEMDAGQVDGGGDPRTMY